MPPAGTGGGEPRFGALDDQLALELGQPGEDREHQPAIGGRGVDRRAFAGQHLESYLALGDVANQIDKVAKIAAEPVELPDDQRVAAAQRLGGGIKARPVVAPFEALSP